MDDQNRELLREILTSAGTAGQQGFKYLVNYTITDAGVQIIENIVILLICLLGIRFLWKREVESEDEVILFGKGIALLAFAVVAVISFSLFCGAIRDLLAPEGAAIRDIISSKIRIA